MKTKNVLIVIRMMSRYSFPHMCLNLAQPPSVNANFISRFETHPSLTILVFWNGVILKFFPSLSLSLSWNSKTRMSRNPKCYQYYLRVDRKVKHKPETCFGNKWSENIPKRTFKLEFLNLKQPLFVVIIISVQRLPSDCLTQFMLLKYKNNF